MTLFCPRCGSRHLTPSAVNRDGHVTLDCLNCGQSWDARPVNPDMTVALRVAGARMDAGTRIGVVSDLPEMKAAAMTTLIEARAEILELLVA